MMKLKQLAKEENREKPGSKCLDDTLEEREIDE